VPALLVAYGGDNAIFPSDAALIFESIGTRDKRRFDVLGDHYGFAVQDGPANPREIAIGRLADWLDERFAAGH